MEQEQDLRRSGRSTRRASIAGDVDSYDDEVIESGLATPPPTNTPKKSRKSSFDDEGSGLKISNTTGLDESKHSFQFNMTKEAFLKDLYSFMHARGQPISKLPSLGYQELDLYLLYQLVIERGGMDDVTRKQEWKLVYQDLGIPTMSTSASYNTRTNYKKYLYLYELEHCDFPDKNRPKDARPKYQISEFIRIVSSVFEGQVFYARILKSRFREGKYQYYVHYNGWSSSHDEWMREDVLDPLIEDEKGAPELLANPPPSRSSKSNHLIYDSTLSEKVISNLVQKSPKPMQNPLSPASPASFKKSRKGASSGASGFNYYDSGFGPSSEEEEAANELIMGMERYVNGNQRGQGEESVSRYHHQQQAKIYRPVEVLKYPMRSDPGEDIAKILEEKRYRQHEQDLIHRNRLHTHVLMNNDSGNEDGGKERRMIAELLKSVKIRIEADDLHQEVGIQGKEEPKMSKSRSNHKVKDGNDPRSLQDIQESLVSLQASLLATQTSYKHTMRALKKHHGIQVLPPLPVQSKKGFINTRRSTEKST